MNIFKLFFMCMLFCVGVTGSALCDSMVDKAPITKLLYDEIERGVHEDGSCYVIIGLRVENFPKNMPVMIEMLDFEGKGERKNDPLIVGENGEIWRRESIFYRAERLKIGLDGYHQGQKYTFKIIPVDKKEEQLTASLTFIPSPLFVKDDKGHSISLEMTGPNSYNLDAKGFKPHQKLIYMSRSGPEDIETITRASGNGQIFGIAMPGVIGMTWGYASVRFKSLDDDIDKVDIKLNYVWGKPAPSSQVAK